MVPAAQASGGFAARCWRLQNYWLAVPIGYLR